MTTETLTIARLGSGGDGIADTSAGPVYVPFTLPGEVVSVARVKNHATVMSMSVASPERVTPPCVHFGPDGRNGTCGGCTLQHAGDALYHAFKRNLVVAALKSKGLTPEVAPLVIARPGERRRVVFTARRTEKGMLLGFNQAGHRLLGLLRRLREAAGGRGDADAAEIDLRLLRLDQDLAVVRYPCDAAQRKDALGDGAPLPVTDRLHALEGEVEAGKRFEHGEAEGLAGGGDGAGDAADVLQP
jgi:predicted RNA-binding protein with TRAM domain